MKPRPAPALDTTAWLNTPRALTLDDFRGRVLVIEAFQMLCPGCVSHGLPQAQRIAKSFSRDDVAVIGLHTVFEHHDAQGRPEALAAFAHEYRIDFPIGIDRQTEHGLPATMTAYGMQGTPTLVVIDRNGLRRFQRFGHVDDLALGAVIGALSSEPPATASPSRASAGCDTDGCPIPEA